MREYIGDFWQYPADAYVITTNGTVKKDGKAVMGAGVAKQARDTYKGIDGLLGFLLSTQENKPFCLGRITKGIPVEYAQLITLPVKHNWQEKADLNLIERSLSLLESEIQFAALHSDKPIETIAMVRPGCGNGGLSWNRVKPMCSRYLDDRYVILNRH